MVFRRRDFLKQAGGGALLWSAGIANASESSRGAPPIRIGQIGVGHAHANKLAVYRASPDYEVVGLVEPDGELRGIAETQSTYRDLPWMTREQLLNVPGLQAVLVETRVPDLLNTAAVCVAAGKHVHLDKPAGRSLPQFRSLLAAAARQGLIVQMGYMYRYNPGVVLLRDFIKNGWLGELFEAHAVMSKQVSPEDRDRLIVSGGHMMFELGCHLLDILVAVLGKPERVETFAQHVSPRNDTLVDNALAVLAYPRVLATVKSSALEVEGFERRHLVVCGSAGTFHIQPLDDPSARVALASAQGEYRPGYQEIRFPKYTRYVADAADMARILRGEKPNAYSYEHDLAVQETVLRASDLTSS